MSQNQVITLPNAPQNRPVICEYAGGHFKLSDKGITFIGTDKDGNQCELSARLCDIKHLIL